MELPVRRLDGSLVHTPQVALDLHYLFTFYGEEDALVPQLLLGKTAIALHVHPNPPPAAMPRRPYDVDADPNARFQLWESGLCEQVAQLRIVPEKVSPEELSKLWQIFTPAPYALSVFYRVSVILITDEQIPEPPLPVAEIRPYTTSEDLPDVEQVLPQVVDYSDRMWITLRGRNLAAPGTSVWIDGEQAAIRAGSGGSLVVHLPPGLPPGIRTVRVTRDLELGENGRLHRVFESNPASFVLRPVVAGVGPAPDGRTVVVSLAPAVAQGQKLTLLLNQIDGGPRPLSYSLPAKGKVVGEEIGFSVGAVEPGTWIATPPTATAPTARPPPTASSPPPAGWWSFCGRR